MEDLQAIVKQRTFSSDGGEDSGPMHLDVRSRKGEHTRHCQQEILGSDGERFRPFWYIWMSAFEPFTFVLFYTTELVRVFFIIFGIF